MRPTAPVAASPPAALAMVVLALLAPVPAQDADAPARAPRRPLIGQVVDAAGDAVGGAAVTVAWNPAGHAGLAPAGVAEATADARGYFAIPAPVGRPLCVWAIGPARDDGSVFVSGSTLCAVGTRRLRIRAAHEHTARAIRVEGLDSWHGRGPFHVRCHPNTFVDKTVSVPLRDDAFAPPPLPVGRTRLELVTADGEVLHSWSDLPSDDDVSLPPARRVPVLALDPEGEPVPDVTIFHRAGDLRRWEDDGFTTGPRLRWREVGATDAEGRAEITVPLRQDPLTESLRGFVLRASKAGCADSHSGRQGEPFVDGKKLEVEEVDAIRFVMAPEEPLQGKLKLPAAQRPARLRVTWISKIAYDNGWVHVPSDRVVAVADDGSFRLPGLPRDAYELWFTPPPLPSTGSDAGEDSELLVAGLLPSEDRPAAEFDATAGGLERVAVRVTLPDGSPHAGGIAVAVLAADRFDFDMANPMIGLDHAGSGALLLPPDGDWTITAIGEHGYGFASAFDEQGHPADVALELEPWDELEGRIVDAEGEPVPGARISVFRTSYGSMGQRSREDRLRHAIAAEAQERYAEPRADANGRFVIRFLANAWRTMQARAEHGDGQSRSFRIEVQDEPLELVIR